MAIEKTYPKRPYGEISHQQLPPEHARIHHFYCEPQLSAGDGAYFLTVATKPNWPDSTWHLRTEYLRLYTDRARDGSGRPLSGPSLTKLPAVNLFRTGPIPINFFWGQGA